MHSFTKIEISWIAGELERQAKFMKQQSTDAPDKAFAKLYQLRAEQYTDISNRLRKALKQGDKRIEIK